MERKVGETRKAGNENIGRREMEKKKSKETGKQGDEETVKGKDGVGDVHLHSHIPSFPHFHIHFHFHFHFHFHSSSSSSEINFFTPSLWMHSPQVRDYSKSQNGEGCRSHQVIRSKVNPTWGIAASNTFRPKRNLTPDRRN